MGFGSRVRITTLHNKLFSLKFNSPLSSLSNSCSTRPNVTLTLETLTVLNKPLRTNTCGGVDGATHTVRDKGNKSSKPKGWLSSIASGVGLELGLV